MIKNGLIEVVFDNLIIFDIVSLTDFKVDEEETRQSKLSGAARHV